MLKQQKQSHLSIIYPIIFIAVSKTNSIQNPKQWILPKITRSPVYHAANTSEISSDACCARCLESNSCRQWEAHLVPMLSRLVDPTATLLAVPCDVLPDCLAPSFASFWESSQQTQREFVGNAQIWRVAQDSWKGNIYNIYSRYHEDTSKVPQQRVSKTLCVHLAEEVLEPIPASQNYIVLRFFGSWPAITTPAFPRSSRVAHRNSTILESVKSQLSMKAVVGVFSLSEKLHCNGFLPKIATCPAIFKNLGSPSSQTGERK